MKLIGTGEARLIIGRKVNGKEKAIHRVTFERLIKDKMVKIEVTVPPDRRLVDRDKIVALANSLAPLEKGYAIVKKPKKRKS